MEKPNNLGSGSGVSKVNQNYSGPEVAVEQVHLPGTTVQRAWVLVGSWMAMVKVTAVVAGQEVTRAEHPVHFPTA